MAAAGSPNPATPTPITVQDISDATTWTSDEPLYWRFTAPAAGRYTFDSWLSTLAGGGQSATEPYTMVFASPVSGSVSQFSPWGSTKPGTALGWLGLEMSAGAVADIQLIGVSSMDDYSASALRPVSLILRSNGIDTAVEDPEIFELVHSATGTGTLTLPAGLEGTDHIIVAGVSNGLNADCSVALPSPYKRQQNLAGNGTSYVTCMGKVSDLGGAGSITFSHSGSSLQTAVAVLRAPQYYMTTFGAGFVFSNASAQGANNCEPINHDGLYYANYKAPNHSSAVYEAADLTLYAHASVPTEAWAPSMLNAAPAKGTMLASAGGIQLYAMRGDNPNFTRTYAKPPNVQGHGWQVHQGTYQPTYTLTPWEGALPEIDGDGPWAKAYFISR